MRRELGMFVALALMCAGLYLSNPDFLGQSNVMNMTRHVAMLTIFAVGLAFVIITGGIDLSVGSIIGLTGVIIAKVVLTDPKTPAPPGWYLWAILGGLLCCAVALTGLLGRLKPAQWAASGLLFLGFAAAGGTLLYHRWFILGGIVLGVLGLLVWVGLGASAGWAINSGFTLVAGLLASLYFALHGSQGFWLAIPVAMATALAIGWGQGALITRLNLQPFIVTLGGMLTIRGISQTIVEGGTLSLGDLPFRRLADEGFIEAPRRIADFAWKDLGTADGMAYAAKNALAILTAYPTLICLATIVIAGYVLHFTVFGRYVYAIGGNRDAAEYSGIPVKKVETTTYVISAGLAALAGVCYASYIGQMSQNVGIAYELYAIAAAVLGGCSLRGGEGTVLGVVIGSAVMRVIDNGIIMFQLRYPGATPGQVEIFRLKTEWNFIIIGGVILIAVVLDQLVHIYQAKRRTRLAAEARSSGFEVAPPAQPPATPTSP